MTIIIIGIVSVTISITQIAGLNSKQQTIYRYIPRTFEEEQLEPVWVTDIFKTMFTQQSPWVKSVYDIDVRQGEKINAYYINQY
jgi:hypothetical protein